MDEGKYLDSEELFRRYVQFVARFLFRMGVRNNDLEDLIQEVFLVVHRNGGYRPGSARPTTYLASIAIRVRAIHQRKQKSRTWLESNPSAVKRALSEALDPLETLLRQVDEACFQEALDRLGADKRAVFLLVEVEGESCANVSAGLNVPLNTVYSRLRVAREQFCKAARVAVQKAERTHFSRLSGCALEHRNSIL
jgi:RNA polymerase sigma-70 factor (ECF subfamily)